MKTFSALLLAAALCATVAAPSYAQTSTGSASTGSDDNGGKSSGGGAPLAGVYDETTVTPEAPMGTIDMSKSTSFTAEQKTEATGRCKVVAKNPDKYKADVVAFCKGMM